MSGSLTLAATDVMGRRHDERNFNLKMLNSSTMNLTNRNHAPELIRYT